ncbi:MAG: hypothetical protein ACLPUT_07065 [Solirubrobacteraceae bacterium]
MNGLVLLAEEVGVDECTLRRAVSLGTLRGSRSTPRKLEIPLSEQEYARGSWGLISTFLAQVVADGRVLVDREDLWPELRRREGRLRPRGSQQDARRLDRALAGIDRLVAS